MARTRSIFVVIIVGFCLLLSMQQSRIADLQYQQVTASTTAFKQQLHPGFACGVLTTVEAAKFLADQNISTSGTIIPADSPTAASRRGSPRLDSCSYSAVANNVSYIDIIIKTYNDTATAKDAFTKDTQGVLYAEQGSFADGTSTSVYSSGVNYIVRDRVVYEISASKPGATGGSELKAFSDSVAVYILQKL